jgi:hypothetical protein
MFLYAYNLSENVTALTLRLPHTSYVLLFIKIKKAQLPKHHIINP